MAETRGVSETVRVEAFSDGVFAIAITLLILEIKVPHAAQPGELSRDLLHLWPSYLAFLTSFCTIGVMWVNHHRCFTLIRRADETLIAFNLLLLLGVTWVPFPTAVLAEHLLGPNQQVAAILYSGSFVVVAIVWNLLWRYAIHSGGVSDSVEHSRRIRSITRQYSFGPLFYVMTLVIGIILSATACLVVSALLAIYFALPPRLWQRREAGES